MNELFPVNPYVPSNAIDPLKIAKGEQAANPELFRLYLAASMTNIDALFGDENKDENENDIFGANSLSSFFPSSSPTPAPYSSVYEEMIARSGLINKTVEAIEPNTNKKISGKVSGITVESGKLEIIIDGKKVPAENLIAVKE